MSQTPTTAPNLVLYGGSVRMLDPRNTVGEALAAAEGRIVAVGSEERMLGLAEPGTQLVNMQGGCAVPGLTDSHCHLEMLGRELVGVDLLGARDMGELIARVRDRADRTPEGRWIRGSGWDSNDWPGREAPDNRELSRAVPDHPVWLRRRCGHAYLANDAALRIAGISRETPDPPEGVMVRGDDGEPTGLFFEGAAELVAPYVPEPLEGELRHGTRLAIAECHRLGLTAVHEAGVTPSQFARYRSMEEMDDFGIRLYGMLNMHGRDAAAFLEDGPIVGERLTMRCVKLMADGSLGASSAAMLEPYLDAPESRGVLCMGREELEADVRRAFEAGFQTAVHAIGDRANQLVLDVYEAVSKDFPEFRQTRPRIEHAQHLAPEDVPRFAALGVTPSIQSCHAVGDMVFAEDRIGTERCRTSYLARTFAESGLAIPNGSDFPVETADPIWGLHCAVTRRDQRGRPREGWFPNECLTPMQALRSYTSDAAWVAHEEARRGTLEPGKLADITVLSDDPLEVAPEEIADIHVNATIVGGRAVYQR